MQFTRSYGPDQPNEEFAFVNGTWRDRCADGRPAHDICPARCMATVGAAETPEVDNNSEHTVRNVTHQVWAKRLHRGQVAVLVLNRAVRPGLVYDLRFSELLPAGTSSQGVEVRDLHRRANLGSFDGSFKTDSIAPHDTAFLMLTPEGDNCNSERAPCCPFAAPGCCEAWRRDNKELCACCKD